MKKRILLLLCVIFTLTGCHGNSNTEYEYADGESAKTDLTIDSSYSNLDTSFVMEDYNLDAVEEIFIYINASTASGKSYLVTREDTEYFNDIINLFWNSDNSLSVTESGYDDYGYNWYVMLKCADEADNITIFVFEPTLIRVNGIFYRGTIDLDYDPVRNLRAFLYSK